VPDAVQIDEPINPPIEVFIVNYSGDEQLLKCVESLLESDYPEYHIRVVDNPPYDPILDEIKNQHPQIDVIKPETNVGYAGAIHIAAKACSTDLLIICNNDIVFKPDCLTELVRTYKNTRAAAVSARIVNPNETHLESEYNATLNPLFFLIDGVFSDRSQAVYPSGACFLIEWDALNKCLPPEEFFLYYEDVFIGMALRVSGQEIVQANRAVVHHEHGYSVSRINPVRLAFYRERNRHACMFIFFSGWTVAKLITLVPFALLHTIIKALRKKVSFIGAVLGWVHVTLSWSYIRNLKGNVSRPINGETICAKYFTSRLIPDDSPFAGFTNKIGKAFFKLLRIKTWD
jgi:hypothetical protein